MKFCEKFSLLILLMMRFAVEEFLWFSDKFHLILGCLTIEWENAAEIPDFISPNFFFDFSTSSLKIKRWEQSRESNFFTSWFDSHCVHGCSSHLTTALSWCRCWWWFSSRKCLKESVDLGNVKNYLLIHSFVPDSFAIHRPTVAMLSSYRLNECATKNSFHLMRLMSMSSGHLKIKSPQPAICFKFEYITELFRSDHKVNMDISTHETDGKNEENTIWLELVPHPYSDHGRSWTGVCLREIIQSNTMRINFQ